MNELSSDEISEFREIFNLVDKDKGGTITKVELAELIDTLGIDATDEDIDEMIKEVDSDSDGSISFQEFVGIMSRKVQAVYTQDQVKQSFRVFESQSCPPGFVRGQDLINALCTYGTEKLTEQQATDLVRQLDMDQNGFVNYAEYVNMMMGS